MSNKTQTVNFSREFYTAKGLRSDYGEIFPKIIDTGKLKVDIDVTYPAGGTKADKGKLQKAGDSTLSSYESLFKKQFTKIFSDIGSAKEADAQGDSKAFSNAKSSLEKLNKFIESKLKTLRVDLRKGMADCLDVESKTLSSSGSEDFVEFRINTGAFDGDDVAAASEEDYSDLASAIKKGSGKWHFCCLAVNGTMAYIAVDRKKPVKRAEMKELKTALGGAVVRLEGICCPKGKSVTLRLLSSSKKEPKKVAMKEGLKAQIGRSWAKVNVACDLDELPKAADLAKLDANGKLKADKPK